MASTGSLDNSDSLHLQRREDNMRGRIPSVDLGYRPT